MVAPAIMRRCLSVSAGAARPAAVSVPLTRLPAHLACTCQHRPQGVYSKYRRHTRRHVSSNVQVASASSIGSPASTEELSNSDVMLDMSLRSCVLCTLLSCMAQYEGLVSPPGASKSAGLQACNTSRLLYEHPLWFCGVSSRPCQPAIWQWTEGHHVCAWWSIYACGCLFQLIAVATAQAIYYFHFSICW